jgi:hypothetical protein
VRRKGLSTPIKALVALAFNWLSFVLWFAIASDFSDSVFCGTYMLHQDNETSTLTLKPDHTYQQEVSSSGRIQHASGTWRKIGEGGVAFSKEFVVLTAQELGADGTSYGEIHKTLGLFASSLVLTDYDVEWYGKGANSQEQSLYGTYAGDEDGFPATLTLKADKTFEQSVSHDSIAKHAQGSWSTSQSGGVVFSNAFIKTTGESLRVNETASTSDANGSVLQIEIDAYSKSGKPVFRKKLLPW